MAPTERSYLMHRRRGRSLHLSDDPLAINGGRLRAPTATLCELGPDDVRVVEREVYDESDAARLDRYTCSRCLRRARALGLVLFPTASSNGQA